MTCPGSLIVHSDDTVAGCTKDDTRSGCRGPRDEAWGRPGSLLGVDARRPRRVWRGSQL